jgi:predicted metal-binding membrane protein
VTALARPSTLDWALPATVLTIAALALATLLILGSGPFAALLLAPDPFARWPHEVVFLVDWTSMCAAMMLPTALPLLTAVKRVGDRRDHRALAWAAGAGFLSVWLAFGMALRAIGVELAEIDAIVGLLRDHERAALGVAMLAGGAYTLSPIAQRCASACQSPMGFIATRWTGQAPALDTFAIGAAYGRSCFGCCWQQMVALAVVGMSNPFWMLIATLAMIAQKTQAIGTFASRAISIGFCAAGLGLVMGWLNISADDMLWRTWSGLCRSIVE